MPKYLIYLSMTSRNVCSFPTEECKWSAERVTQSYGSFWFEKKMSLKWKSSQRWTESMQNSMKLKPKGMCSEHTDGIFIRLSQSLSQLLVAWNRIIKTCVCCLFFEYLYENVLSFYLQRFVMDSQMSNGYLPNVSPQHLVMDGGGGAVQEPVCGVCTLHLNLCDSSSLKRVHFSD